MKIETVARISWTLSGSRTRLQQYMYEKRSDTD